jgi:hypothetical protein
MSDPLPTIVTATAQGGAVALASVAWGVDPGLLHIMVGGIGGALFARVMAPLSDVPLSFLKAFAIFFCSVVMSIAFGGFAIEVLSSRGWFTNTLYSRAAAGFAIGLCAQGIAEFVQAVPRLAQANLVDAVKAIFSRLSGKGAQ